MNSTGQKTALQSCLSSINQQSNHMKQCLAENNLLQALKHCSNFLNELRTNKLSPKQYYEIYMAEFDSLDILSNYLLNSHNSKKKKKPENTPFLADLYELVQYSGNIIPRLYMMVMIGTTYMSTNDAPSKEIMKDMIEMCRGVQHPIRGLFLRYYLSQRTKNLLPLSDENDFNNTVDFLISNFIEMNKLWVRLQHQGHSSERELRSRERKELKILVGSNLVRLSQVIDDYNGEPGYSGIKFYKENVFPVITEQIIQCRDHLAQSYLIDVLIQIFPANFHFSTLNGLFNSVFINLHPALKKSELISTLIERFILYHKFESDISGNMQELTINEISEDNQSSEELLDIVWEFYLKIYELDPQLPAEEHSLILRSYIKLTLTYFPDNYKNLDRVYEFATERLSKAEEDEELWLQLLVAPIRHFDSIKNLLELSFFHQFYLKLSDKNNQKQISLEIMNKILESSQTRSESISTQEEVDAIFQYLLVLIKDTEGFTTSKDLGVTKTIKVDNGEKVVTQDFLDTKESICKVIHLIDNSDPFKSISNLMYVRKKYLNKEPKNIIHTYPTLISVMLHKLRLVGHALIRKDSKNSSKRMMLTSNFKNLSVVIDELYQHHQQFHSELILRIYMNAASIADQLKLETISYELFNQCFIVYEENLILNTSNSSHSPHEPLVGSLPYQSIILIANRLMTSRYFTKENYENLITKLTLYGSKLLKKQDQCRAVYSCAHLWWWSESSILEKSPTVEDGQEDLYRDPKRVLECIQKALRVADSCMDPYLSSKLFVEILNRCLIFNIYGNTLFDARYINGLIDLIKTNIENLKDENIAKSEQDESDAEYRIFNNISSFFDRSLAYISYQQQVEDRLLGIHV